MGAPQEMTFEVNVTEDDIIQGCRHSDTSCPVALAILRAIPADAVRVGSWGADIRFKDVQYRVYLPEEVRKFILDFDFGRAVKPFTFVIRGLKEA